VTLSGSSSLAGLRSLLLAGFLDEGLVNVRDDTSACDGSLDERVELLVTTNGKLEMPGRDALDLVVLGSVTRKFQYFGRQVLEDGRAVDRRGGAHAAVVRSSLFQETMDSAHRELQAGLGRTRNGSLLLGGTATLLRRSSFLAATSHSLLFGRVLFKRRGFVFFSRERRKMPLETSLVFLAHNGCNG